MKWYDLFQPLVILYGYCQVTYNIYMTPNAEAIVAASAKRFFPGLSKDEALATLLLERAQRKAVIRFTRRPYLVVSAKATMLRMLLPISVKPSSFIWNPLRMTGFKMKTH